MLCWRCHGQDGWIAVYRKKKKKKKKSRILYVKPRGALSGIVLPNKPEASFIYGRRWK
jgi:hypothetical protein